MSVTYHGKVEQPYRIQKRLALNQCFKAIHGLTGPVGRLAYVTFGGKEIYDAMDFLAVFDIRSFTSLHVVSYEQDLEVAAHSRTGRVAETLNRLETITVRVFGLPFPDKLPFLSGLRYDRQFIYFLDDTGTFSRRKAAALNDLLSAGLLREGDFVLITSCINPRVVHQPRFMSEDVQAFRQFYGQPSLDIDQAFRVRNHVDYLVRRAFSKHERISTIEGEAGLLRAVPIRKYKYQDTEAAMGLWLYQVGRCNGVSPLLTDNPFDEFPYAFESEEVGEAAVPDLFD